MLNNLPKVIALVVFAINIFLAGLNRGFEFHYYKYGVSSPWFDGFYYFSISLLLLIFYISKSIKNALASNALCIFILLIALYGYKDIYLYTKLFAEKGETVNLLIQDSVPLNWISFTLILILLSYQIINIFRYWMSNKRKIS